MALDLNWYKLPQHLNNLIKVASFWFCLIWSITILAQQRQIDSLLLILPQTEQAKQSPVYYQLAQLYAGSNTATAIEYAQQALAKSTKVAEKINSQILLGSLNFRAGNLNKAIGYYQNSRDLSAEVSDERLLAQSHTALGGAYFITGNLTEALNSYLQALRLYEQRGESSSLVSIYNGLANIYSKQNNFTKALEFNLKAITYYEASSDKFRALMAYDQVGNMYLKQGNFNKAKQYFNQSLALYKELNNTPGIASTKIHLGDIQFKLKAYDAALVEYKASLQISKQFKMLPLQAAVLNAMALVYEQQRLYDKAITAAKGASAISEKANLKIELEQAYETLARLYKLTSNLEKATTFTTLSKEIKDSLYNDSTLKQLADLQLRYEGEKKQQQIEIQQKEQQVLASELLRERQVRNAIIAALMAVILGLIIFVILFTQNRRIAKNLAKQKRELETTTAAVIKQKEELSQLNNVKDRFFSIISHDLRNNLTTMKLYFDLVGNKDYVPDEDGQEFTKQISSSVENTIDLLENLLVWAQTQINGIEPNPTELNLHQIVENLIGLLGGSAHQKNISLVNNVHKQHLLLADADMVNLVVRNLVSNAIKFTNIGGAITVTSLLNHESLQLNISDTGVGMSESALNNLFTKNANSTTLGTANEKGTGLGLILCKEFVEKNGGTIQVTSKQHIGSTFTLTFPIHLHEKIS
jgi:signal transduction histidine kinase